MKSKWKLLMRLPNIKNATVPVGKIVDYLLSLKHEDGQNKAQFFHSFGFRAEKWETMRASLLEHAEVHEVKRIESSPFGTRYVIEGPIKSPDGRWPVIRAVWFIETGAANPRFVTAYPLRRRVKE